MHRHTILRSSSNTALAAALLLLSLGSLGASSAHAMERSDAAPDGLVGAAFGGGPGPNLHLGVFGALAIENLPIAVTGRGGAHTTSLLHTESKEFLFFEPGLAFVGRLTPLTVVAGVGFGMGHERANRCPLLAERCPDGHDAWVTTGSVAAHAFLHRDGPGLFFGLGLRGQTFAFRDFAPLAEAMIGAAF